MAWPAIRLKLSDKLDVDRDMQTASVTEAEAQYYLGDLLLHMGRRDVAETQLHKAIALDPKLSSAYASFGLLKVREGQKDEALKLLAKAVENDSKNHLAHYYYAQLLQRLGEDGPAGDRKSHLTLMREHTRKAIELVPRFTPAYDLLGYIALVSQEGLDEAESALKKAIEFAPGRTGLRLRLAELMVFNNEFSFAQQVLASLNNSAVDDTVRFQAERLLDDIKNRREFENNRKEYERDLAEYERRRREVEDRADRTPVEDKTPDEPPRITRKETNDPSTGATVIETAKPTLQAPEGIRVEGLLAQVDCSTGLTLRVRVGNTTVELHTDMPQQLEFVSYVSTVADSFACGVMKPELPVAIVYRRTANRRFLGEPLRVEFIDPKSR